MKRYLTIHSLEEADKLMDLVRASALRAREWMLAQAGDPLYMLRQINQTWTFAVAVAATQQLLLLHPDVGGFHLAPGAHAALELDIMSVAQGQVGAETFAAVTPRNNGKLEADLTKLSGRSEAHRYVFFMSPLFPANKRLPQFERGGIEVWAVNV